MTGLGSQNNCIEFFMKSGKITIYLLVALITIIFWPFWMLFARFLTTWKYSIAPPQTKFNMREQINEDMAVSARAMIIEVAIESSFQPLLQLYILFPFLFQKLMCYHYAKVLTSEPITSIFGSIQQIQFFSVLTSVISLAWSFTFYQSLKKKGALDFGANLMGRVLLLMANLLQISSRLLVIVIYAYLFGPGNFWPMIISVICHILLMAALNYIISYDWLKSNFGNQYGRIFYHCLLNGICNLYLHNWIVKIDKGTKWETSVFRKDETSAVDDRKTFFRPGKNNRTSRTVFRQFVFDIIFILETCIIVIVTHFQLGEDLADEILTFIVVSQVCGIFLKMTYYNHFHIWKNAFTTEEIFHNIGNSMKNIFISTGLNSITTLSVSEK